MKTLQEYILEAMSKDVFLDNVKSMFGINDDYESAYNVLKSANSTKGLLDGVENYIKNENEIKTSGYYLAMLFELSGLPVKESTRNQHIIKSIIKDNNVEELNIMLSALIKKDDEKNSLKMPEKGKLTELEFCKDYENLANYIYDIEYFEKTNNSSANGKGELLLSLLIGGKNNNGSGDVKSDNNIKYEIKSSNEDKQSGASLGNTFKTVEKSTEEFISKLAKMHNFEKIEDVKTILNEKNEFLLFKGNTHNGLNNLLIKTNNIKLDNILTCLIQIIFERYDCKQDNIDNIITNIKIKYGENLQFNKKNTNDICGILHLIAYSRTQKFNYLVVIDKETKNFKTINCDTIENIFDNCSNNIGFYSKNDKETNKDGSVKSGRKNSTYAIYYKN
jgi:hypothetical protein